MRNDLFRKGVVVVIIMLFIGTNMIPNISGDNKIKNTSEQSGKSTTDWWPMFHHDSRHGGYSTSTAPSNNNVLWTYTIGGEVFHSPAVVNSKVYIGSSTPKLCCLNADTGAWIWDKPLNGFSSPAVVDGKVYLGSGDSKVYCLNADTGSFIWNYTTGSPVYSSPAVVNGKVYVGSGDTKVYCLNADTGVKIWEYTTGGGVSSSPAVVDGKVYVGSQDNKVYCLDADTGAKIWEYTTGVIESSPSVANGKVYIGSWDNRVYCLDVDTGAKIWAYTTGGLIQGSSPAVVDGKVYIGSNDYKVYCLNADTGANIWEYTTAYYVWSSPAVANGKVFIGSQDNKVYCLNDDTGMKIWDYTTGNEVLSSPAVADGKVYVGSKDGKVYCFGDHPPNPPIIDGPHCGKINTNYTFTIDAITDPGGDQIYCLWDWGDGNTTGWLGPYNSGGTITATHTWSEPDTYKIQVKTKDTYGAESNWSEPFTIYITSKMLLIGYVQSAMNQGDECIILNLSIALIIKLKPINLKMYSSLQVLILNNELHGVLGSKFLAVLVYALVLSEQTFTIHPFRDRLKQLIAPNS